MGNKIKRAIGISESSIKVFPLPVLATKAPTSTDINYPLGQSWVRTDTAQSWTLCKLASGVATWAIASPGASDVDTINALSPAAGNITLAGGTNLTDVNAGSTVTFNLDSGITLATSVTSPIYASAAAMAINVAAGSDITVKLGDAAAANKISYVDSASAEVASIDSDGTATFVNMDGIIGASTPAALTATTIVANTSVTSPIYTSTGAVDTNINAVASQDIIVKMGDNAAVNKVSFVDSDSAEVASIDSNGAFTTTGLTFTGLLTASASATINTAGTALNLATDNSGDAVNIGTGATIRAIGIGNAGGVAHTVAIGSANAGVVTLDTAASFSLDAATDSNLTSSAATATALIIEASNAAGGLQLRAGSAGILVGTEADTAILSFGDVAPTSTRTTTISGGTVVTAAVTDTVDIAPDGATTNANSVKTVNVNTGTVDVGQVLTNVASGTVTSGTHTTNIASGNRAAGTMALNVLTGTGTKTMNAGNADALTTFNFDGPLLINDSVNANTSINTGTSTGAVAIGNALSGTVTIDSVAVVAINSAGAAVNVASDADDFAANFGTAGTRTVTVGSTTGASALVLQSGTGRTTMTGTVKEIDAEFLFSSGTDLTVTQSPLMQSNATTGVAPTGVDGDVNLMYLQDGCLMEQFIIGTQTIVAPRMSANGLAIELDNANAEGVEYNFGARNSAKHAYTIGTSAAFFVEATLTVADLSGCAPLMVGFRKVEANNKVIADYTDYFCAGLNSVTSATNVVLLDELNGGGQTATDSTDAWTGGDTGTTTIRVLVSAAGVCTYTIDGGAPSATNAMTFDNTDVVMPFLHFLNGADVAGEVALTSLKCGFQA